MLSVLTRHRDLRRLFGAQLIVFGADWFVMVPLLVLLNDLTHKGLWGGLALGVETGVVALLLPYAGTLADRFDRKHVLIASNLGVLTAISGLFFVRGPAAGPIALVAVAVLAVAKAFYSPAATSSIPNVVPPEDLRDALAITSSAWGIMAIIGSSLGGVLSGFTSAYHCFGLVAAGLVVSAWLTWRVDKPLQQSISKVHRPAFAAIHEALRYLRGDPRLMSLVTVKSAVGLGNGVLTVFPMVALAFHVGSKGLGLMFAARGLGAIIGPILFRRVLNKPALLLPGLALSMTAYGLAYIGVAFATWFPLVLVGVLIAHIAGGGNWVMSNFAIQQAVPDELRGRVSATDTMIAMLAITVSQLVIGLYVDSVSTTALFICCSATTMSYAVGWYLFTHRYVIRRPAPAPAS
ncbi:MFS transporter [Rhizocola hellebori]|uniref:MFS transporter n=1 Tax=Rhizocola hellebori TaxID=1392758 RepID=A0A8J3QIV0_9ACTN|nr:MFS transporter [Rhizocola hellebori]GIH11703.1 MFS transporter [Rhizocola hellebori]